MKKLIYVLALIGLTATLSSAQSTTPRTTKQTIKIALGTDATGQDTLKIDPREWETIVNINLRDTLTVVLKITSNIFAYYGDVLKLDIRNSSGSNHYVRLPYAQFKTTSADSTIGLTSSKNAIMTFMFDGSVWKEQSLSKNE